MRSLIHTSATVTLALALAAGLAGCTAQPSAPASPSPEPTVASQSVTAACNNLEKEVSSLTTDLTEASALLSSDLTAGAALVAEIAASFEAAVDAVENEEVYDVAKNASAEINAFSELLDATAADPANADIDAISASGDTIQAAFIAIGEVCE